MTLGDEILSSPFQTAPLRGQELRRNKKVCLQVMEWGIWAYAPDWDVRLTPEQILRWDITGRQVTLAYLRDQTNRKIVVRLSSADVDLFRRQFNLMRVRHYVKVGGDNDKLAICPHCGLIYAGSSGPTSFCPECLSFVTADKSLSISEGGYYNFCDSGLFALVELDFRRRGRFPQPTAHGAFKTLKSQLHPIKERLASHVIWLTLWFILSLFSTGWVRLTVFLLAFGSSAFALGYAALLYFRGAFRSPSTWDVVVKLIEKGEMKAAEQLSKSCRLDDHPGCLANLGVGWYLNGDNDKGWDYLSKAAELCPNHPALIRLVLAHAESDRQQWEHRLATVEAANSLRHE